MTRQSSNKQRLYKGAITVILVLSTVSLASCNQFKRFSSERYNCQPNRAHIAQIDIHERSGKKTLSIQQFGQNFLMTIISVDNEKIISRNETIELTIDRSSEEPQTSVLINDVYLPITCFPESKFSM